RDRLKREQRRGEEARQPAGRVAVIEYTAPGIGNLGVGHALRGHLVVAVDVVDADQTGQANELITLVQAQGLFALDQQRAVGQHARHGDGDGGAPGVLLRTLGRATEVALAAGGAFNGRVALAAYGRYANGDARFLAESGACALARLGRFVERHGKNIADT